MSDVGHQGVDRTKYDEQDAAREISGGKRAYLVGEAEELMADCLIKSRNIKPNTDLKHAGAIVRELADLHDQFTAFAKNLKTQKITSGNFYMQPSGIVPGVSLDDVQKLKETCKIDGLEPREYAKFRCIAAMGREKFSDVRDAFYTHTRTEDVHDKFKFERFNPKTQAFEKDPGAKFVSGKNTVEFTPDPVVKSRLLQQAAESIKRSLGGLLFSQSSASSGSSGSPAIGAQRKRADSNLPSRTS